MRLIAAAFCGALALLPVLAQDQPHDDPLPLRRVLISRDRLAELAQRGTLVQLPRADFEARVKKAALAGHVLRDPPRLLEAKYRATLVDSALVGTGEWKIANPTASPAIFPVQPFNLALRQVRWQDSREAILGDLGAKQASLGLLVEHAGENSLSLDWSARGTPLPGDLHFELRFPLCPVAALELDLPADHVAVVPRDTCLLSGPHPAAASDRRTWRIAFGGQSQVDLSIRAAGGRGQRQPVILSRLHTTQELSPGQVQADFEFDLEVAHQGVRELTCECDAALRPYDVQIRNLSGWELKPSAGAQAPATLLIRLREPFQGDGQKLLKVRCLAPIPSAAKQVWTSPGMRLVGAVPRGEELVLRVNADVQLDEWQPGSFRLVPIPADAARPKGDDGYQLRLVSDLDAVNPPRRPSARIRTPRPEFRVQQTGWWQLRPDRPALAVEIDYAVARGRVFQLPLQLPAGWQVERVEMSPPELLRNWAIVTEMGRTLLVVDLQRPLDPGMNPLPRLKVALNAAPLKVTGQAGVALAFPDLAPQGARLREGALGISLHPMYQATAAATLPSSTPEPAADAARKEAWGDEIPDFYYRYRGPAVDGTLKLRLRPSRVQAHCTSQVVLSAGRAAAIVRLELVPEGGAPQNIDLLLSAPAVGPWNWTTVSGNNQVKSFQRRESANLAPLSALAARSPLEALVLSAARPARGQWYRLALARPLRERLELEAHVELSGRGMAPPPALAVLGSRAPLEAITLLAASRQPAPPAAPEQQWVVPLLVAPAAERMEGEVTIFLTGAELVQVEGEGLREVSLAERRGGEADKETASAPRAATPWRTFHYSHPPVSLKLSGLPPAADRSVEAVADQAFLTVYAEPGGRLLHHYRFQVWNWRQRTLPVRLPAAAELLAARSDGRWLGQLPAVEDAGLLVVHLPVAAGPGLHRFELVYGLPRPAWSLVARLEAPEPQLPIRTLTSRRTWCLPPGTLPLVQGDLLHLPGGRGARRHVDYLHDVEREEWTTFELTLPSFLVSSSSEEWMASQRQRLAEAVVALRRQHRESDQWTLGQLLERLVLDHLKERAPLVVDVSALRDAGLGPDTSLTSDAWERSSEPAGKRPSALPVSAPWESLGVVYVPCQPAPLLTTRRHQELWRGATAGLQPVSPAVEQAVAQALLHGHDASGRFRTVADWLESADAAPDIVPESSVAARLVPDSLSDDWTEWEPLAGTSQERLLVIRQEAVPVLGMVLAGVLLLGATRLRRMFHRWRFALLLAWLGICGLALLWLPPALRSLAWWPMLAGLCLAVFRYLRFAVREFSRGGSSAPPARTGPVVAAALALVFAASLPGQPAVPAVETVWILPGPANAPAKQTVLVSPELLKQLDALAERGAARGAVLLRASYEGRVIDGSAHFEARIHLRSFSDEAVTLTLPLGAVKLQEALLDGAAAYPVALRPPRDGYSLDVKGKGSHVVVLRFVVLIAGAEDRELRFTVPDLPQSRLVLDTPGGAAYLHAPGARGQQRVLGEPGRTRLEADLGRLLPDAKQNVSLHVRWRQQGAQPRPASVRVQEAYLWDLRVPSARLLGVLQYSITQGTVTRLALDLPKEMEVRSPPEAEVSPSAAGAAAPRLKDWQLTDAGATRRLLLDFQGPVTGNVQVTLDLAPRQPLTPNTVLTFPTPVGAQQLRGMVAYRVEGLESTAVEGRAVTGIAKDVLAETFQQYFGRPWRTARQEEFTSATAAFWSTPGGAPLLRLSLQTPATQVRAVQNIWWQVGQRQVDLRATARVTDPEGLLNLVEWDLPPLVTVAQVSGADVRYWSRTGSRVQVWLQRPLKETSLQVIGWVTRKAPEAEKFELPCLRLMTARTHKSVVRVSVGDGLALAPDRFQNLTPLAEGPAGGQEYAYSSDQLNYKGAFQISPARDNAEVRLLTFVEVRDRRLTFVSTLDYHVHRGELRSLTVSLRKWDGEAQLDVPAAQLVQMRELKRSSGRSWAIDLKSGVTGRFRLTLSGSLPLQSAPTLLVPDVRLETSGHGPAQVERWLAVAGPELSAEPLSGLQLVPDPERTLGAWWPKEANRVRRAGGAVWRMSSDDWRLRLRPRLSLEAAPIQVFLAEQSSAVVDGRRWVHQASWCLYHEAGADLRVILPEGADPVLAAAIDGQEVVPLQPAPGRLWVPLPGAAGVRTVRLSWTFDPARESLDRPNLDQPRLEGLPSSPALWTVHVPASYQARVSLDASSGPRGETQSASAAGQDLRRAAAQLRLLTLLGEQLRGQADTRYPQQIALARQRFERSCRLADYRLAHAGADSLDAGPDGQTLTRWLQQLRDHYSQLVKTHGFDKLRGGLPAHVADTGEASRLIPLPEQGTPSYWQAKAGATAPRLKLVEAQASQVRQTWIFSGLFLVLLVALWGLALFPRAVAWPEQLALLGCLGMLTFGPGWAIFFLPLPLFWLIVRILALVRRGLALWNRPVPVVVSESSAPE